MASNVGAADGPDMVLKEKMNTIRALLSQAKSFDEDSANITDHQIWKKLREESEGVMELVQTQYNQLSNDKACGLSELFAEAMVWLDEVGKKIQMEKNELKLKRAWLLHFVNSRG